MINSSFILASSPESRPTEAINAVASLLRLSGTTVTTHPLGFIQTIIFKDGAQYRLNIWGTPFGRPKLPDWQVHNHRFTFSSNVLIGRLLETRYQVREEPLGEFEEYKVAYQTGGSKLCRTGRRLTAISVIRRTYSAGQSYEMDADTFHSTVVASGLAISAMQIGRQSDAMPTVLGTSDYKGDLAPYVPTEVPLAELLAVLKHGAIALS